MKRLIFVSLCSLCLVGCGTNRHLPAQTDSVRVDTRVEYRDRIVMDTVRYEQPVISERIVTRDTVSVIENDFFISKAEVRDGFLEHEFRTKPKEILIPVEFTVHDLKVTSSKAEVITHTIEVEKNLTLWQRACILLGKILMAAVAVFITYSIIRKGFLSL